MSTDAHGAALGASPEGGGGPDDTLAPLPGELGIPDVAAPRRLAVSKKGLLAVALLVLSLIAVSAFGIQRFSASGRKTDGEDHKPVRDKPTAATAEPRKLEMTALPAANEAPATAVKVPAIVPTDAESAEPIVVRRTGTGPQSGKSAKEVSPEDAPILLVSSRPATTTPGVAAHRPTTPNASTEAAEVEIDPNDPMSATSRNLQGYQRQLQGLLDNLTRTAEFATSGDPAPGPPASMPGLPATAGTVASASNGLFGGQLQGSATPRVAARLLGNRSLTLPKGTAFTCALKTRVISAASGLVGCQVLRNVFSDDGRVLLIERGSHLDGEYRITSVRPGAVRIPVLWTRIRTPLGVTVDIDSPATGKLGESGIDGHVDNRWWERIGAAMLLSLIDDSVKLVIQNQASSANSDRQADTIVLPSTTANTSKLAEKVLDSTINIPPLIYQNQGGIVGIYVARDVDFSTVYELAPTGPQSNGR
jgi:type IV secretion system protein VirB10